MAKAECGLLFIDMAYTLETVLEKRHEQFYEMRHSGGYFDRVWGVHPLADIAGKASRRIEIKDFSSRQTIVEGVAEALPLPKAMLPFNLLWSQWKLLRLLKQLVREKNIKLIAATDAYYGGLLALLVARATGRPLAVSVFSNQDDLYAATGALFMPRLLPFRFLEQWVARLVLSRADLVIAGNRNNMKFAQANGAQRATAIIPVAKNMQPVHLLPPEQRQDANGVLARLDVPSERPLMLYVGRLLALKHPDEAVRAMAATIERCPDAIGLLAGDGPMREELAGLIASLGMTDRIRLLGHIDQETLSLLTPHCITISPLTGMALIECGLGGSPIVAFDRDWQAEFVEDGVNGFIVPFLDHAAMAERAIELIRDTSLRQRMSQASRARALEFADLDRIHAHEREVYGKLLAAARE